MTAYSMLLSLLFVFFTFLCLFNKYIQTGITITTINLINKNQDAANVLYFEWSSCDSKIISQLSIDTII